MYKSNQVKFLDRSYFPICVYSMVIG